MEIKLSTGEKVKLKDLTVDERDEMLDSQADLIHSG